MAALKGKALIAYVLVCVFWGSTYLAIKVGVTELPPFLFAGLRFAVAGLILLAIARALGDPLPRRSDWKTLAIVGLLLLGGGNAFVVWSEQYVASGIASIFVVTVAIWTALRRSFPLEMCGMRFCSSGFVINGLWVLSILGITTGPFLHPLGSDEVVNTGPMPSKIRLRGRVMEKHIQYTTVVAS